MFRRIIISICLMILVISFAGCGESQSAIDPNAKMIGSQVVIGEELQYGVVKVMETTGSDYAKPEKGFIFYIVKFQVENVGKEAIEVKESDFYVNSDGQEFVPIASKLNFVVDKMAESIVLNPGDKVITKLVWMLPKKQEMKVVVFTPSNSTSKVKFNMVEE